MQQQAYSKINKYGLLSLGLGVFLFIFFKNAWVADDAYISFRSIEQVFAGNGPRWNIDERVQVYTSPMWFGLLLAGRVFSNNLFLLSIFLSAFCCVCALLLVRKITNDDRRWLIFVLLATGVNSIMDFSSSGLENSLLFLWLSFFFYYYFRFFQTSDLNNQRDNISGLMLILGLMSVSRHDSSTLVAIPAVYAIFIFCKNSGYKTGLQFVLKKSYLVISPLLLWTLFSVVYYGVPFPNTAYAKMLHGISRPELIEFGWLYLKVSIIFDVFAKIILAGLIARVLWKREKPIVFLLLGVALNFFYVVFVGGDFMQGRFISEAMFVATIGLVAPYVALQQQSKSHEPSFRKYTSVTVAALLVALALYSESPLTLRPDSGFDINEGHRHYSWRGILNERNFYFKTNSLWAYYQYKKMHRDETQPFPEHKWCKMGISAREQNKQSSDFGGIGMYGYCAGLNLLVIDNLALGEPFLARLPMPKHRAWRAGHYHRDFPRGYMESRISGRNQIIDPHLALLWDDVALLTRGPLFTSLRWQAIWRINAGYYRNIGDDYFADLDLSGDDEQLRSTTPDKLLD